MVRMRPRHRRWIALVALLGLLFQQLAMAAYVCPIEARQASTSAEHARCHANVAVDKARCHQHCSPQPPSPDHPPAPTVPALLPATTWPDAAIAAVLDRGFEDTDVTARAAAPPLTVQHCTFQI